MGNENSLREDISYLRQMAESGRKGQILGGIFLAGAGVVFGCACVISYAGYQGFLPMSRQDHLYLWLGAFALFTAFWVVMFLRMRTSPTKSVSASNTTFGTIWGGCGIGVMVSFAAVEVVTSQLHAPVIQAGFVPTIFAFYGTAWFASAALAKRPWMHIAAAGSFVFAFIMALLTDMPVQILVMGAGLLLLLTLPGLKLIADEARK
jgi:hypothetical protein